MANMEKSDKPRMCYFAHSFRLRNTEEEKEIMNALANFCFVVNPFDNEDRLEKKYGTGYYHKVHGLERSDTSRMYATDIVKQDYELQDSCTFVFAYVDMKHQQIGTLFEIARAIYLAQPVIIVCEQPSPFFLGRVLSNVHWFATLKEAYRFLENLFN